jgi:xanthine/uracil/vitamin C permease (AzgA family)
MLDRLFKLTENNTTWQREVSGGVTTFMMGLVANFPIALAPAMGHNFFFTYVVVLTLGYAWQQALRAPKDPTPDRP